MYFKWSSFFWGKHGQWFVKLTPGAHLLKWKVEQHQQHQPRRQRQV